MLLSHHFIVVYTLYFATSVIILPKDGVKAVPFKTEIIKICKTLCINCNADFYINDEKCLCNSDNLNDVICLEAQVRKANYMGFAMEIMLENVKNISRSLLQRDLSSNILQLRSKRCLRKSFYDNNVGLRRRIPQRKTPEQIREEIKYRIETLRNLAFLGQMEANSKAPNLGNAINIESNLDKNETIGSSRDIGQVMGPVNQIMQPVAQSVKPIIRDATMPLRNRILSNRRILETGILEDSDNIVSDNTFPSETVIKMGVVTK